MDSEKEVVYKRGDVYWLKSEEFGLERKNGRPIVIVSSDKGNEVADQVIGLSVTTRARWGVINVEIATPRKKSWVQCNWPVTMYKDQLSNYLYTLTETEMSRVELGMCVAMGLTPEENDKEADEEEKRSLREEIDSLRTQLSQKKDVGVGVTVERDMYKKMYEKALEMLAAAKIAAATEGKKAVVVEEEAPTEETATEGKTVEEKKVEINTCTEEELRSVGCTPTMIHYIIENRPYKSVEDIKRVPMVTRVAYKLLENRIFCIPIVEKKPPKVVEPPQEAEPPKKEAAPRKYKKVVIDPNKKVNMNTATREELMDVLGLCKATAQEIVSNRKLLGNFESIEDVTRCSRFGQNCLKKYGPMMEV